MDNYSRINGKKGGRPKSDSKIYIKIPGIQFVMLTQTQYETLEKKYGESILNKALTILDEWFQYGGNASLKYIGKNNYAHFRSDGWVINTAIRS